MKIRKKIEMKIINQCLKYLKEIMEILRLLNIPLLFEIEVLI